MKPLVSVIVPVHDVRDFLRVSLDSILASSHSELEVIAVDDGSRDGSGEILDEYAAKDSRVKVVHQENAGAGPSRNLGLSLARGKYVAFVDPDDFVAVNQFERLVEVAEETNAQIVGAGFSRYDASGKTKVSETRIKWRVRDLPRVFSAADAADRLFATFLPAPWNKLFRRDFIVENKLAFQSLPRSNDLSFSFTALALADRLTVVDETLYCYRMGRVGGAQNSSAARPTCIIDAYRQLKDNLERAGILPRFAKGFVRMAASSLCYTLSMLADDKVAREFYDKLASEEVQGLLKLAKLKRADFGTELSQFRRYAALTGGAGFSALKRVIEGKSLGEVILARLRRYFQ